VMDLAAARFDLVQPLLARYKRRFTVLDLGAGINPYMAQRISNEFDAVVVALEQDEVAPEELAKFGPRALWLRKKMSALDIERLATCEHFDVILAFNILHWMGEHWSITLTNLWRMATHIFVQTPAKDDRESCGQEFVRPIAMYLSNWEQIGETAQFPQHSPRPIFYMEGGEVKRLTASSLTSDRDCNNNFIRADLNYKTIELRHKNLAPKPFIHGLNLWNFAQLNGQWPRKEAVLKLIREFPLRSERHGDITPHNFLFDGAELHLIDGYEGWEFDDRENLLKTERMMEEVLQ
jgi:hypothetical protein